MSLWVSLEVSKAHAIPRQLSLPHAFGLRWKLPGPVQEPWLPAYTTLLNTTAVDLTLGCGKSSAFFSKLPWSCCFAAALEKNNYDSDGDYFPTRIRSKIL